MAGAQDNCRRDVVRILERRWRMSAALGLVSVLASFHVATAHAEQGAITWSTQFGSAQDDAVEHVAVTAAGEIYVVGLIEGNSALVRKYAAAPGHQLLWSRQLSSGTFAREVDVDSQGNAYVVGNTSGSLPGQIHLGGSDIFLRKYDAHGNEVWTRQFGTNGADFGEAVAIGPDDSVYVGGYSETDMAPGFVYKYSANGELLWQREVQSTLGGTRLFGLAVHEDQLAVVGSFMVSLPDGGGTDPYVRVYDTNGEEVWTVQFHYQASSTAEDVAFDPSGNVVVVGHGLSTSPRKRTGFLRKYTPDGNFLWQRLIQTFYVNQETWVQSVAVDEGHNVYVTGYTQGDLSGPSAGGYDGYVQRYNSGGSLVWSHQFGTSADDFPRGVAIKGSRLVYVGGHTRSGILGHAHQGGSDAFIAAFDAGKYGSVVSVNAPPEALAGEPVTFTAVVSPADPGHLPTPTGWIRFSDEWNTILGEVALDSEGSASLEVSSLWVGWWLRSRTIQATYLGDSVFNASTARATLEVFSRRTTITTLTSSPNPSVSGEPVTFTATVSARVPEAGIPTGTVTFYLHAYADVGTAVLDATGRAVLVLSNFDVDGQSPGDSVPVLAMYNGEKNFDPSASDFVEQVFIPAPVACSPGSYLDGSTCVPAPPGTYVASAGATEPTPCAPGTFQPLAGQTSCLQAPVGSYVDVVGANQPTACPPGTTTLAPGATSVSDCVTSGGGGGGDTIAAIVTFMDEAASQGTLRGNGPGRSGPGRLAALRSMLSAGEALRAAGDQAAACGQLLQAYRRTDGDPRPPDFVAGNAAPALAQQIWALLATWGCRTGG